MTLDYINQISKEDLNTNISLYTKQESLLVDGNYFINVKDVIQTGCTLETIDSTKKIDPTQPIIVTDIKTYFFKDYYVITKDSTNRTIKHTINSYLTKKKVLHLNKTRFSGLYGLKNNDTQFINFTNGIFPKILFHPIKFYFNRIFFYDQYYISDFIVDTNLRIIPAL